MDIDGRLPETPRGNKYILVVGEYTKWKEAFPLKDTEPLTIAKVFVNEFVCRFGVPDSLHAGQGRNFKAKVLKEVCQLLGVKKTRTTPYHPPRRWTTCSRKVQYNFVRYVKYGCKG